MAEAQKMKDQEPEIDFAKVSEMNYEPPPPEDATEITLKYIFNGAAGGVIVGRVVAELPGNKNVLFGYYSHDGGLVFLGYCGVGLVIGLIGGWIYSVLTRKKQRARRDAAYDRCVSLNPASTMAKPIN
jgi:H+/Cl- antiporter ClcA